MKEDYLIIATDINTKASVRFLSLQKGVKDSLELHKPEEKQSDDFAGFLMLSVLMGSLYSGQEATLFKLRDASGKAGYNAEVSPKGTFRSAIIGKADNRAILQKGQLKVVRVKKSQEVYQSVVQTKGSTILNAFRSYLKESEQTESLLFVHIDTKNFENNYSLWIDRLPGATEKEWLLITQKFNDAYFNKSFANTEDPDQIIQSLFPEKVRILVVTKPVLYCSCSKERITEALKYLPEADLTDIFVKGEGVKTKCDYCHKEWVVTDEEMKEIMKSSSKTIH